MSTPVEIFESTITLPTYAIRGENRNPVFHSQYGVAHIYPYTLLDDLASVHTPRSFRTLNLENQYLRVTVLPDLGGRVYSVFDKISQREVFYKNPVVKFAPLAIRGAFFSGGVEFSFPVAHAPTSADPVNWDMRQNPDGSATISFGGLEHISRMRWTISLTLYPDRCALAQDVQLQNPSPVPGRYHYWTNASLAADDDTEFAYPLRRVRSYEFAGAAPWPTARIDLQTQDPGLEGMEGVPKWPAARLHTPVDMRWQRDMLAQVSIFGREVKWDYFGAWQHSSDYGYAHYADHRNVAGMKLWSWGKAGTGIMNQAALTDDGSLYAETQCGAMETQLDFDFLPPGYTRRWREWWLPLRGLGGLTCASGELGARIHLAQGAGEREYSLSVGLCPVRPLDQVRVRLSTPHKTLVEETATMTPEKPWLYTGAVSGTDLGALPLTLIVTDAAGQALLNHTLDRDASPAEPFHARGEEKPTTADDYYKLGLKHENFDNREEARQAYAQALGLNAAHGPAHLRLGLMQLRAAEFDPADKHLRQAIAAGQGDANYHLGALLMYQNKPDEAETFFEATPGDSPLFASAQCGVGRIALGRGQHLKAAEWFRRARAVDANGITAALLLAVALRHAHCDPEAKSLLEEVLDNDPLNHPALRERSLLNGADGAQHAAQLERLLRDDRQYHIDLACFYIDAGLLKDAREVLLRAAEDWDYPMVAYLLAELARQLGNGAESKRWLKRAADGEPAYVFPSRLEEVQALVGAIRENPGDLKAKYYLGNFLYAHERFEAAVQLWEEAAAGLAGFDVILRNLALYYWQRRNDLARATELLEQALQLAPENQDLYIYLDQLYTSQNLVQKRAELVDRLRKLAAPRDDVHKRLVVMLVDLGRHEEAIQMLTGEEFMASEMDQSFRRAYVKGYLARAQAREQAGRIQDAIADYRRALEFPANVGVGKPVSVEDAEILYRLGCACEQLGRFEEALTAWRSAAGEYHPHGTPLFEFVQNSLDKLNRYSEIGFK